MSNKHILVIGAGSVGKRHLRNLSALGCNVSAFDPREDRLEEASGEVTLLKKFTDFNKAMKETSDTDGVVIASPPKFHIEQCIAAANAGLSILLEKPVSRTYSEAKELQKALLELPEIKLLLGYTYRWWPPLHEFRERLSKGYIGKPLHAKFVMSAHLADWHPWERYQDFFMANKELGGGALLDESHFLDLMIWFFGMPAQVFAKVERLSSLEIETDDNVDMVVVYESGLRVVIHLDLYGRPHEKFISITGDAGTLQWSFEPNSIRFGKKMGQIWEEKVFQFERNDMFVNSAKEFIDVLDGKTEMSCKLQDGMNVLQIIEACRESSQRGCVINT